MTLTLHVDAATWRAAAARAVAAHGDVVAVVKGNGYGFGRGRLATIAGELGLSSLAVGTVHELADLPPTGAPPLVLTPALSADAPLGADAVLTIGSAVHAAAAPAGTAVSVKLASSMRRYGVTPEALPALLRTIDRAGLAVTGFAVHLPLGGDAAEVDAWLPRLPAGAPLSVSHLDPDALHALRDRHPGRRVPIRLGTALWHGARSTLSLRADVLERRPVGAGDHAGYRLRVVPGPGTVVMIGAGTAHGVRPLADGLSPFHFALRRLCLVEPPHMHTSMAWVPAGDPCPEVGDEVDVQQPLTFVTADRVIEH